MNTATRAGGACTHIYSRDQPPSLHARFFVPVTTPRREQRRYVAE